MTEHTEGTFADAIRAALLETESIDMRQVAARAAERMTPDLLMEAAITHLSKMARRYYNTHLVSASAPAEGGTAAGQEVLSLRGTDVRFADTDQDDREWLARNRERLADGLRGSASRIRDGVSAAGVQLRVVDVARAERRAGHLENAAAALERLIVEGPSTVDKRVATANVNAERHLASIERYRGLAGRVVDGWRAGRVRQSRWTRTEKAMRALERVTE